jgi:hypothetical protein
MHYAYLGMDKTRDKIIKYIEINHAVRPEELIREFGLSKRAIFKQLENLLNANILGKRGTPPLVVYFLKDLDQKEGNEKLSTETKSYDPWDLDPKDLDILYQNFLIITPKGEMKRGIEAFSYWCRERNLDLKKSIRDYIQIIGEYNKFKKDGFIDGMYKMDQTFKGAVFLDKLYYLEFYSIERFGKTELGTLLLYAKQGQNRNLMKILFSEIYPRILKLIKKEKIDAIGFIPPTLRREVQFMKEMERYMNIGIKILDLPRINIVKTSGPIVVAQKSLNKLEDRIENAKDTIFIDDFRKYNNILLIDDAVGSGATLNETAKKLKEKNIVQGKVVGLGLTGSFKGFDVINEI